jgi:hypothetical protein
MYWILALEYRYGMYLTWFDYTVQLIFLNVILTIVLCIEYVGMESGKCLFYLSFWFLCIVHKAWSLWICIGFVLIFVGKGHWIFAWIAESLYFVL